MKKVLIAVVLIILVAVVYVERHAIKTMFMGAPTPATTMQVTPTTSTAVPTDNIYTVKTSPTKGQYLADFDGKTLYVFDHDTTGISNCENSCAQIWPAYTSGATAQGQFPTNISVITRKDGTKQFAWKGMPLYYYAQDTKAGDTNGDGFGGIWHLVKP